jgi:hypothetical protein
MKSVDCQGTELGNLKSKQQSNGATTTIRTPLIPRMTSSSSVQESRECSLMTISQDELSFSNSINSSSTRSSTGGKVTLSSIREVIIQNPQIYRFSCLSGIIFPEALENVEHSLSKHNLRYRMWGMYLWGAFILTTVGLIIWGFFWMGVTNAPKDRVVYMLCSTFGVAFQNIFLYPAIVYLQQEIDAKRENIDKIVYEEAFEYASKAAFWVGVILFVLLIMLSIIQILQSAAPLFASFLIIFIAIIGYSPCNFMLVGVFTFLVMEQRVSYHAMNEVKEKLEKKELRDIEYLEARESIKNREKVTPINWLLSDAVISTIFGIIFVFLISRLGDNRYGSFIGVFNVLTIFGRQTIVLVLFLLEVAKVNQIEEVMMHHLAKTRWTEDETKRLNLYLVMKELPMGSTVFFYRPSKNELLFQIASTIIGIGFAVFWAVVFA